MIGRLGYFNGYWYFEFCPRIAVLILIQPPQIRDFLVFTALSIYNKSSVFQTLSLRQLLPAAHKHVHEQREESHFKAVVCSSFQELLIITKGLLYAKLATFRPIGAISKYCFIYFMVVDTGDTSVLNNAKLIIHLFIKFSSFSIVWR